MATGAEAAAAFNIHASCVALGDKGVLIGGKSGSGKSALTLQLMAFGAELVSDDRTVLHPTKPQGLRASAPAPISGLIEARGVGLLRARVRADVALCLMVDMDRTETQRLPEPHVVTLQGIDLPCLYKVDAPHFPAAILQYLKGLEREIS